MKGNNLTHTVLKEIGFTLLEEGKTIKVKAEGFSMYPNIKPGSVIYIEPVERQGSPVPGEIIARKSDCGFVIHRLIRIVENDGIRYYITRGDSSMIEDEPFPDEIVGGRITRVEYPGGRPVKASVCRKTEINYSGNRFLLRMVLYLKKFNRIFGF